MTATVTTPTTDRRLLADVSAWAHVTGWTTRRDTGWQNPSRIIQIDWDERGLFIGRRDGTDRVWPTPSHYPATSVRQAVDLLAALGILPPDFSSAYRAGVQAHAELVKAFLPDVHITEIPASAR